MKPGLSIPEVDPSVDETEAGEAAEFGLNESADLLADLLEPTGLVPLEGLGLVRRRAVASGSFAEALLEEGIGSSEAAARALARRTGLARIRSSSGSRASIRSRSTRAPA
jgi:hypothetical protein